jgi:hypothetical protein
MHECKAESMASLTSTCVRESVSKQVKWRWMGATCEAGNAPWESKRSKIKGVRKYSVQFTLVN